MSSDSPPPYVQTRPLVAALAGRHGDVLDALGVPWQTGRPHIKCPYSGHDDGNASWRWDVTLERAFCTCMTSDSVFDVVAKIKGLDFEESKLMVAETIGRRDLIVTPGMKRPRSDAASLLTPPIAMQDNDLVAQYLGFRLGITLDQAPLPMTPVAGWRALPYFDAPAAEGLGPELVGNPPAAVFGQLGADGKSHAHRIYVASGGRGKAALGNRADGTARDPKKSAKVVKGDRTAGRCVWWGSYETASAVIVAEGIETAAALAFAHGAEIAAGGLAVAAAISAAGVEQFQPWPNCRSIWIAADRDEGAKPGGRPGSRRGEQAAVKLAGRLSGSYQVSILLPGASGEGVDWLDVLRRDGVEAVRAAFASPAAWHPTHQAKPKPAERATAAADPVRTSNSKRADRFRVDKTGVSKSVERDDPVTGETRQSWQWFASPLDVIAATRDDRGEDWGRLLEVVDRDGTAKSWAMPMAMLAGDGANYRERLLSLGLELAPGRFAKEALHEYIATARPDRKVRCVVRVGWHAGRFVLPDAVFSGAAGNDEGVILQSATPIDHAYRVAGDLVTWQDEMARLAVGNSRLLFSIAAAFAGCLLELLELEGGGFHLRGASSVGKSTALTVSGSVWGGGGVRGYVRSWRATDNAMETMAGTHCDALLCLDELAQIAAEAAGATAYMLTAGAGKQRAGRHGEGRPVTEWRVLFLSTGEISLADKLSEDGKGRRAMAGQGVRVVDMPADAGTGLGLFEQLHGHPSAAAFAKHLKTIATAHYGHPARAFLAALVEDVDSAIEAVRAAQDGFVKDHSPPESDGQVTRVAQRFGLVAAAGELAAGYGILPWNRGDASAGAARCFRDWLEARGGVEPAEEIEGVRAVRRFIEAHGTTRFERLHKPDVDGDVQPSGERANSRVGYREQVEGRGTEYFVLPTSWKEVCGGHDTRMVAPALVKLGALVPSTDGKFSIKKRLPIGNSRCYHLTSKLFESAREE